MIMRKRENAWAHPVYEHKLYVAALQHETGRLSCVDKTVIAM